MLTSYLYQYSRRKVHTPHRQLGAHLPAIKHALPAGRQSCHPQVALQGDVLAAPQCPLVNWRGMACLEWLLQLSPGEVRAVLGRQALGRQALA